MKPKVRCFHCGTKIEVSKPKNDMNIAPDIWQDFEKQELTLCEKCKKNIRDKKTNKK